MASKKKTAPKTDEPLHVVALESENFKRIRAIRVKPDGSPLVLVGGRNAQGKSSLLDGLQSTLEGLAKAPREPIRKGARTARNFVDLGGLTAERIFTEDGSKLIVRGSDGLPMPGPQGVLDALLAKTTIDPVAFLDWDAKRQAEELRRSLGLDFRALDDRAAVAFQIRTEVNREAKAIEARVRAIEPPEAGLPSDELSIADLTEALDRVRRDASEADAKRRALETPAEEHAAATEALAELDQDIAAAEAELVKLRDRRREQVTTLAAIDVEVMRASAELAKLPSPESFEEAATKARQALEQADQKNAKIRRARERRELEASLEEAQAQAEARTRELAEVAAEKARLLAGAEFPIPGLSFDDESGIRLNDAPLEQASQAEKLRLAVALFAVKAPRIRIAIVRQGSNLDLEGLELLAGIAAEFGVQVWVERVSQDGAGCQVVIEDGLARSGES